MAKQAGSPKKSPAKPGSPPPEAEAVPAENVEILRESFGLDLAREPPERVRAAITMAASISASPYLSPEMFQEYVARGFPELPNMIVATIDRQTAHRQELERLQTTGSERRLNRAQWGALCIGLIGLLGSLGAGYLGVPPWICVVGIVVSIGGPNGATVLSRFLDRLPGKGEGSSTSEPP